MKHSLDLVEVVLQSLGEVGFHPVSGRVACRAFGSGRRS